MAGPNLYPHPHPSVTPRASSLPPIPPTDPPPPGPYRALPTPSEEQQVRQLQAQAARNHRSLPPNHPARRASQDLAELLQLLLDRGVPASHLAGLFDPPVTHQAVRARAAASPSSAPFSPLSDPPEHRAIRYRPDAPHDTSLITSAPYRRVRLLAPPYPVPPAPLPVFYPPNQDTSDQFLQWLSSPTRAPGAAYADNGLIRLHLTPVTATDEEKEPK